MKSMRNGEANTPASTSNDGREFEDSLINAWSAVVQHNWVLGRTGLNQITGQMNSLYRLSDATSTIAPS